MTFVQVVVSNLFPSLQISPVYTEVFSRFENKNVHYSPKGNFVRWILQIEFLSLNHSIFFFSDIFHSKHWTSCKISDPSVDEALVRLRQTVLKSRSIYTVCKYSNGWLRWKNWASAKSGMDVIPVKPLLVAVYLQNLINEAIVKNLTFSVIYTAIYSIRWVHHMAGYSSPTDDPIVSTTAEAAKRMLG